jgi:hypothetical protein
MAMTYTAGHGAHDSVADPAPHYDQKHARMATPRMSPTNHALAHMNPRGFCHDVDSSWERRARDTGSGGGRGALDAKGKALHGSPGPGTYRAPETFGDPSRHPPEARGARRVLSSAPAYTIQKRLSTSLVGPVDASAGPGSHDPRYDAITTRAARAVFPRTGRETDNRRFLARHLACSEAASPGPAAYRNKCGKGHARTIGDAPHAVMARAGRKPEIGPGQDSPGAIYSLPPTVGASGHGKCAHLARLCPSQAPHGPRLLCTGRDLFVSLCECAATIRTLRHGSSLYDPCDAALRCTVHSTAAPNAQHSSIAVIAEWLRYWGTVVSYASDSQKQTPLPASTWEPHLLQCALATQPGWTRSPQARAATTRPRHSPTTCQLCDWQQQRSAAYAPRCAC